MGEVFGPKDLLKGRRKLLEEALRDLGPSARYSVLNILHSWEGEESQKRLIKILSRKRVEDVLKSLGA